MPNENKQDRTERATPKKRRDARKKGQVAVSKEVSSAAILLVGLIVFYLYGPYLYNNIISLFKVTYLKIETPHLDRSSIFLFLLDSLRQFVIIVFPILLSIAMVGVVANVAQTGFLFSTEALSPKISKLNPISGLKRLYSARSFVELVKSLTKICLIGTLAFFVMKSRFNKLLDLTQFEIIDILILIGKEALIIGVYTFGFMLVLAALDYTFQRWHYEKDLKMTKQEVKDEMKNSEGDPKVKARIRSIQQEMSRNRMMSMVPDATVIITNPTHISVAIKYDSDKMDAPKVVAKGAGILAQKIKDIAYEKKIPIVEKKSLARLLYKRVDACSFIPLELYQAVAEIIAYIYKLEEINKNQYG